MVNVILNEYQQSYRIDTDKILSQIPIAHLAKGLVIAIGEKTFTSELINDFIRQFYLEINSPKKELFFEKLESELYFEYLEKSLGSNLVSVISDTIYTLGKMFTRVDVLEEFADKHLLTNPIITIQLLFELSWAKSAKIDNSINIIKRHQSNLSSLILFHHFDQTNNKEEFEKILANNVFRNFLDPNKLGITEKYINTLLANYLNLISSKHNQEFIINLKEFEQSSRETINEIQNML